MELAVRRNGYYLPPPTPSPSEEMGREPLLSRSFLGVRAASSSFQSFFEEETVVSVEFQIFNSNGKLTVLMKNVDSERCPLRTIKMRASKGGLVILNVV